MEGRKTKQKKFFVGFIDSFVPGPVSVSPTRSTVGGAVKSSARRSLGQVSDRRLTKLFASMTVMAK
jgi:hypothetical protein